MRVSSAPRRVGPGRLLASALVTVVAFAIYRATLLPGLDLGDTAALQDAGGALDVTPRQAYPLYFAVGNVIVWLSGGEPAFGMNLASALCAALACGLLTWLAADVAGSTAAGLFSGGLFASSYTFWSQAVIAEVYALHALMLVASLLALTWWGKRPESIARLAAFFAVYALGFGNHLMMVLLLPAATLFLAMTMPEGPRGLLRPRVMGLAALMAALGALQYSWNYWTMYAGPVPPASPREALETFWFDVTKSDWRSTMVLGVHQSALRPRLAMYWFDLRQQFGVAGILAAVAGLAALGRRGRLLGLVVVGWLVAVIFAYTYNVGDVHVFFVPSHVFVALAAACGLGFVRHRVRPYPAARWAVVAVALAYPVWRVYDTWPAVDRSADRRPAEIVRQLAGGLPSDRAVLLADLNWQLQNGLDYYARHTNPDLLHMHAANRMLTLPWLIEENLRNGRDVVLSRNTARLVSAAFGTMWTVQAERQEPSLLERLEALPPGTPFVLALLSAYRDSPLDTGELARMVDALTGGTAALPIDDVYTVMVGRSGARPALLRHEPRPFRLRTDLAGLHLDIRMESWLPPDTIRRAGFGHVIVNHRHVLTVDRGVSVVALGRDGTALVAGYVSGLFAPEPRFRIRAAPGT